MGAPVFVSPPSDADDYLDDDNNATPRYRILDNVLRPATPTGLALRNLNAEHFLQIGEKSVWFNEVKQHAS